MLTKDYDVDLKKTQKLYTNIKEKSCSQVVRFGGNGNSTSKWMLWRCCNVSLGCRGDGNEYLVGINSKNRDVVFLEPILKIQYIDEFKVQTSKCFGISNGKILIKKCLGQKPDISKYRDIFSAYFKRLCSIEKDWSDLEQTREMKKLHRFLDNIIEGFCDYVSSNGIDSALENKIPFTRVICIINQNDLEKGDVDTYMAIKNLRKCLIEYYKKVSQVNVKLRRREKKVMRAVFLLLAGHYLGMCPRVISEQVFNSLSLDNPQELDLVKNSYEYVDSQNIYRRKKGLDFQTRDIISRVLIPIKLNKYLNSGGKRQYIL